MNEVWCDVKNYEGIYQVSNLGRVRRLGGTPYCPKDRLLKPRLASQGGYPQVTLSKECKATSCYVHRLVADAFIPNPQNYTEINHLDENKKNNCASNLEWTTRKGNMNYGTLKARLSAIRCKPVNQFTLDGQFVQWYPSAKSTKYDGFVPQCVSLCCSGKQKYHKGFRFQYA